MEESVPERQRRGKPEHEQYEALCALAAGGLLEGADSVDFETHMKECSECRSDYKELSSLVTRDLTQAPGTLGQKLATMKTNPLPYSRQRFLRRARAEGVVFSREVETPAPTRPWFLRPVTLAPVAFLVVVAVSLTVYHFRETPDAARANGADAAQRIAELKRENAALTESLAAEQRETQNLRRQLGSATAATERLRQAQGDAQHSSSQNAQLSEETRNQENLLAEARNQATRINQLHSNDVATLVEQQTRITELTNKLRIASATLEMERQLAAAGKDLPELMAARQLHVVDVREAEANGEPSRAFGRVFLTEGKSLTFYAFDLNEDSAGNAKRSFQVWADAAGSKKSARSLGFLHVDAKGVGRWVLRVENPELVKEINSVFVTAEPGAGGKQPSGEKMLYAYLGDPNHP